VKEVPDESRDVAGDPAHVSLVRQLRQSIVGPVLGPAFSGFLQPTSNNLLEVVFAGGTLMYIQSHQDDVVSISFPTHSSLHVQNKT